MGVSGGEEGALNGPSIMPGGPKEAYDALGPLLEDIAAKVDGEPCCTHIGADGAGHFVKMVHNGIEYADMQLIAEAYDLLRKGLGLDPAAIAETFRSWNAGRLDSYLMEITSEVLSHVDADTGKPFVDVVADEAEQKGTGRWTVQGALELGVPVTGIAEAVFARSLSGARTLRDAARDLPGTSGAVLEGAAAEGFADDIEQALYASKIVAYAQGFNQIQAGAAEYDWSIDLGAVASIWRGGCIIRARFLDEITAAYRRDPELRDAAHRHLVPRGAGRRAGLLAARGGRGGAARHPGARLLDGAVLLRRAARRAPARGPRPGPARLLRCPHLPAHRPRGHVPHPLGRGGARAGAAVTRIGARGVTRTGRFTRRSGSTTDAPHVDPP